MRQTRASMLETLSTDYVRTARAKGLPRGRVLRDYALRNSLIVVVTIVGLQLGGLISGAVVTERIFGLPGFGKLTLDSVFTRDYPVIQAVVLVVTAAYIVINLAVDVLYSVINPRIRVGGSLMAHPGRTRRARRPPRRPAGPTGWARSAAGCCAACCATRSASSAACCCSSSCSSPCSPRSWRPYPPTQVHFETPFQRTGTVGFWLGTDDLGPRHAVARHLRHPRLAARSGVLSVRWPSSSASRSGWSRASGAGSTRSSPG